MKMINKILITLLIIAMAASMLPMALAAEEDYTAGTGETVALKIDLGLSYGFELQWKNVTYSNPAIIDRTKIECDGSKMNLGFGQVMDNGVWYLSGTKPTEESVFIIKMPVSGNVGDTCTITLKYELCFDGVHPAPTTKTFTIEIVEGHVHAYEWKYNDNQHWQECSCGEVINTGAHTWEWVIDKAATEYNPGVKHEACKTCGATRNEGTEIPATHQCVFGDWKFNATKHWKECSCGERIEEGNHTWEWVVDQEAGEFEVGQKHEKCSVCGAVRNEGTDIPETHVHSYGEWQSNGNNHWKECSCGERVEEGPHRWSWIIDKEATETTSGLKHEECTICGRTQNMGTIIPAKHDCAFGDWLFNAEKHWKECSCGAKAQEGAHVFGEWVITKYPSATVAGAKERKCSVCEYKQTERIDPTGSDPTTPTTPVDPSVPTTPTTPVDPSTPTTPVDPSTPTTPVSTQPSDGGEEKGPCLWWLLIILILILILAWYFLFYKKAKDAKKKQRRVNPLDNGANEE